MLTKSHLIMHFMSDPISGGISNVRSSLSCSVGGYNMFKYSWISHIFYLLFYMNSGLKDSGLVCIQPERLLPACVWTRWEFTLAVSSAFTLLACTRTILNGQDTSHTHVCTCWRRRERGGDTRTETYSE